MRVWVITIIAALTLSACSKVEHKDEQNTASTQISAEQIDAETARLNEWFETKYEESLLRSPVALTFQGRPERKGEIDDMSEAALDENIAISRANLAELKANFDYDKLSDDAKVSYDIWVYQAEREFEADKYRYNTYVFEQMSGVHSFLPQLLISFHSVTTEQDMIDFNSRIKEAGRALNQLIDNSMKIAKKGVRPPYFAFEAVITESQAIITGAPFSEGEDSAVWESAKQKTAGLVDAGTIDQARADALLAEARENLISDFKPAYERLIAWQKDDQINAGDSASGVSALPNGVAFYNERLANQTTTSLTADEIHEIGLSEVARIRQEMEVIKNEFGFAGELSEFFAFLHATSLNLSDQNRRVNLEKYPAFVLPTTLYIKPNLPNKQ